MPNAEVSTAACLELLATCRDTADGTSHSSVGSTEQSVIQSLAYRIQIRVGVLRTSL
jgi:hypothetical protein